MERENSAPGLARFGAFEVDFLSGELRKGGVRIKLQDQPLEILRILLEKPGTVVTREDLQKRIWPADTFVEFDHGLYTAITKLREALGDSSENPRFIETLPRRGYRFMAPVQGAEQTARRFAWRGVAALAVSLLALALGLGTYFARGRFWPRVKASSGRAMLAVLPFQNLTGDPNQDYFSEGLTEEMITDLGRLNPGRLGVIARTSVMRFKDTREDVQQIGHVLGVDYVLEGAVRRQGDQVRITAQLIQVRDQTHLWAQSYDRELHNILAVQEDVARNVADEIKIEFPPQLHRLASTRAMNPDVHELYLKGRYFWNKRTEKDLKKGFDYFQQAIEKDPVYAPAYVGLADSYLALATYWVLPQDEAFPMAKAAALRALQIDDALAEAHVSLAVVKAEYDWDFVGAEREFQKALLLNPNYSVAHQWYAEDVLAPTGRFDEAIREMAQAQQLDPSSLITRVAMGFILIYARQYDRAIEQERNTVELDPNFPRSHYFLGFAYEQKRMYAAAIKEFQKANALDPSPSYASALGHAHALAGQRHDAWNELNELDRKSVV